MAGGKPGPGPGTKVGSVPQVRAAVPQPSSVLKRPYIQHGARPILFSDRKQSQGISTQPIELVVITDAESESSDDDKNWVEDGSCWSTTHNGRSRVGKAALQMKRIDVEQGEITIHLIFDILISRRFASGEFT
jgi:hypothetical protein